MSQRQAEVSRDTLETQISVSVNLDGAGSSVFETGVPFLDHMLDQVCRHGMLDLEVRAQGDLHIDAHHTVEDIGITLGQAVNRAVGDKRGIRRYGHAYVPLDEALSRVVMDFSGRPGLEYHAEFFQGFVNHAQVTMHIDCLRGENAHHIAETIFKAFGRAMRMALEYDTGLGDRMPSTKGSL
jgi:imidazoleglycerol-phosphate dehydratase